MCISDNHNVFITTKELRHKVLNTKKIALCVLASLWQFLRNISINFPSKDPCKSVQIRDSQKLPEAPQNEVSQKKSVQIRDSKKLPEAPKNEVPPKDPCKSVQSVKSVFQKSYPKHPKTKFPQKDPCKSVQSVKSVNPQSYPKHPKTKFPPKKSVQIPKKKP